MPPLFSFTDGLPAPASNAPAPFSALAPPEVVGDSAGPDRNQVERALMDDGPAEGYAPTTSAALFSSLDPGTPQIWRYYLDLPRMLMHPRVSLAMSYVIAGTSNAEFEVTASSPAVARFIEDELDRLWNHSLFHVQSPGYCWGWAGCQVMYTVRNGLLACDWIDSFESRDVLPLVVKNNKYVGMRVQNVQNGRGYADLWGPGRAPPKAFWYVHQPRKGRLFGFSQCYPSWWPWHRLANRDGVQASIDLAVYKFGIGGAIGRFPKRDTMSKDQSGEPRVGNREKMMQLLEGIKNGVNVALASTLHQGTNEPEWDVKLPERVLDVSSLIEHVKNIKGDIDEGCGVPSELIEASETGSGYSGRLVPLEAFFCSQQHHATSIVRQWKDQIGDALVRWNFGRGAWFDVKVKPLLETRRQSSMGGGAGGDPAAAGMPGQPAPGGGQPQRPAMQDVTGPKGGHYKLNPQTGAKHSAAMLSTGEPMAMPGEVLPAEPASLGCALLELPQPLADKVLALAAEIDSADLVPDGKEDRPHITARFGLLDMLPELPDTMASNVARALVGMGPVEIHLGPTGIFAAAETGADYDVVDVSVVSPALHALHRLLADVPHVDTHPRYCPHVTLAYVRPGRGLYYAGDDDLDGETATLDVLTVSDGEKRRQTIRLDGSVDAVQVGGGAMLSTRAPAVLLAADPPADADDWLAPADNPHADHHAAVAALADGRHDGVHAALMAALAALLLGSKANAAPDWGRFERDVAAAVDPVLAAHDDAAHLAGRRVGIAFDSLHDATVADKRELKERLVTNIVASVRGGVERATEWGNDKKLTDDDRQRLLEAVAGMGERQVDAVLAEWEAEHKKKKGGVLPLLIGGGAVVGILATATEKASANVRRGAGDALWGAVQAGQVAAGKQQIQPGGNDGGDLEEPESEPEPEPEPKTGGEPAEPKSPDGEPVPVPPGVATKTWWTEEDDRVCVTCAELHGQTVPVGEPFVTEAGRHTDPRKFQYPPAHPSCRCHVTVGPVRTGAQLATDPPATATELMP